jgi:hypothetical protein
MKTPNNNWIALIFGLLSTAVALYIFAMSRSDPGLRMAALVAATSTGAGLLAVCSTLLTGKDLTKPPSDMPPNSTATQTSTVQVGPVPPPVEPPKEGV